MVRHDTYESYAYELGFMHAMAGYENPCKSECDRFYWLGYQIAKG